MAAVIRLYAAYRIHSVDMYTLAFWTYLIALVHFMTEWLVFGTTKWGIGLIPSLCVAWGGSIWMLVQWTAYVG